MNDSLRILLQYENQTFCPYEDSGFSLILNKKNLKKMTTKTCFLLLTKLQVGTHVFMSNDGNS